MSKILELEQIAESMGITITEHFGGEKGRWYPDQKTISIQKGLHPIQYLCTFAHELGHAYHKHEPGASSWVRARQEREANEWAATFLISESNYQQAECVYGGHVGGIAGELGVTHEIVLVWRNLARFKM